MRELSSVHHCPTSLSNRYLAKEELWTHVPNWVCRRWFRASPKACGAFLERGSGRLLRWVPVFAQPFGIEVSAGGTGSPQHQLCLAALWGRTVRPVPASNSQSVSLLDQVVDEEKQLNNILQSACFPLRPQLSCSCSQYDAGHQQLMLQEIPFWAQGKDCAQPVSTGSEDTFLLSRQQHGVDHTSLRCCPR